MPRRSLETWALAALLGVHILLGVYYSVSIPIWEAHDEIGHYYFVRYVAREHGLPRPGQMLVAENDESHQPPLYYIAAAVPVALANTEDGVTPALNPHMWSGPARGGVNRVVHDPEAERWPYRGTVLAVHLARWVSVLLGALGLCFTFAAARVLFPAEPWVRWGATLVLALWPHYRFSTAVVNNDIMVTACAGAATWLLAGSAVALRPRVSNIMALGATTALALLAKNNALSLLPPILVVLVAGVVSAQPAVRRRSLACLLGATLLGLAIVGWWYAQNVSKGVGMLGGNRGPTELARILGGALYARRSRWGLALPIFSAALSSVWASFGWGNLSLPAPLGLVAAVWGALGLLGLVGWFARHPPREQARGAGALLLVVVSVSAAGLAYALGGGFRTLPGRYLLPALPALSILLAKGWSELLPGRLRATGWAVVSSALGILAVLTPALYIQPAYAQPRRLTQAQAAAYVPAHVTFGDFAQLVGYQIDNRFVGPRDRVHITLVWRVLAHTKADYSLAVQVFEGQRDLIGEIHRFPGQGAFATTAWEPGYLFSEDFSVPINSKAGDGHLAWVEVSFYNHLDLSPVTVSDADGRSLGMSARIAQIKVRDAVPRTAVGNGGFQFGSTIRLLGCAVDACLSRPDPRMEVDLQWAALGQPDKDYTVSLQLRNAEQVIVAQIDAPPRQGTNPTSFWQPGEVVNDHHSLPLPVGLSPGTYTLHVCMYDAATLQRLPVVGPAAEPLPNAEVLLLTLTKATDNAIQVRAGFPALRVQVVPAGEDCGA